MRTPDFRSKRWLSEHRDGWCEWVSGPNSTRLERMDRLSQAVTNLTHHVISAGGAPGVAAALPTTLKKCNELAFDSEDETLAYSVWHLIERYARVLQVLDGLVRSGDVPLRKTRLTALEVGAGPMPALHAVRDFYADLTQWSLTTSPPPPIVEATQLYTLDRAPAWGHFNHIISEQLMGLGDGSGPHKFAMDFLDFQSFSVREAHRDAVESAATRMHTEALEWGESLTLGQARNQIGSAHGGPPSALDLIIVCNFLTQTSMTSQFEAELAELARSLTPGGVLVMIGSASEQYDAIFDSLDAIVTRTGAVTRLTPRRRILRINSDLGVRVTHALVTALQDIEAGDMSAFDGVRDDLPGDVRHPGRADVRLPDFRIALFKNEGVGAARPHGARAARPA